jgi:iron complex outermembrane receptor protein
MSCEFDGRSARLLLALILLPALVAAEESSPRSDEETVLDQITVTSRKRTETLRDVPASIALVEGEQLERDSIRSASDIARLVPGLQMIPQFGNGSFSPVIRGLSTSFGEPNVGFFIDGVYVGSRAALDFLLGDGIERVEVARGPQSALYGRNSFAGAINFVTRDPADDPAQSLRVGIGSDARRSVQWSSAGKVGGHGSTSYRIAANQQQSDGHWTNELTGNALDARDDQGLLFSLALRPDSPLDAQWLLKLDRTRADDFAQQFVENNASFLPPLNDFQQYIGDLRAPSNGFAVTPGFFDRDTQLLALTLHYAWEVTTLTSVTSFNHLDLGQAYDADYSAAPVSWSNVALDEREFSQELRLSADAGNGLDWMLGVSGYRASNDRRDGTDFIGPAAPLGGQQGQNEEEAEGFASFWQLNWRFAPAWTLTFSGRLAHDRKALQAALDVRSAQGSISLPYEDEVDFVSFTPGAYLSYVATENLTLYASAARASKLGGFNTFALSGIIGDDERTFDAEHSTNLELGAKWSLLSGRALAQLSVFDIDWQDQIVRAIGTQGALINVNAGTSRSQGMEASFQINSGRGTDATLSLSYVDAAFEDYQLLILQQLGIDPDLSGTPLQYSPRWSAQVSLGHEFAINASTQAYARLNGLYRDRMLAAPSGGTYLPSATYVDLDLGVRHGDWEFTLWAQNLLQDKAPASAVLVTSPATQFDFGAGLRPGYQVFQPLVMAPIPRSYGLGVRYRF